MTKDGKEDGKARPILEGQQDAVDCSHVCSAKGPTPYAVKFFATFLRHLGYRRAVLMSDGEHAVVALKEQAAREGPDGRTPEGRRCGRNWRSLPSP